MAHKRLRVVLHVVWATWERQPLLTEEIERPLYRYIQGVCRRLGCDVLALGGVSDHLHLVVTYPSTLTIERLVEGVKGASSRFISEHLLGGAWFAWQRGYSVTSVSPEGKDRLLAHVRNQKAHHGEGSLWSAEEPL